MVMITNHTDTHTHAPFKLQDTVTGVHKALTILPELHVQDHTDKDDDDDKENSHYHSDHHTNNDRS